MQEKGRAELLKELLKAESREISLRFKLSQLFEETRIKTIRLSGILSTCKARSEDVEEYYEILRVSFEKYLDEFKRIAYPNLNAS